MILRALIVDDEAPARRRLRRLLERIDDVEVVGEACDGEDASAKIAASPPDLLLLDIEMPELDGLRVAAAAPGLHVVFVTAHAEHAVAAFDLAAVDYLLKPITEARLRAAIDRVRLRASRNNPVAADALAQALRAALPPEPSVPRVTALEGDAVHIFDARSIARFSAANRYVSFTVDGREYLLDDSLNALEARLRCHEFQRVHRAELINLGRVRTLRRTGGGAEVELDTRERVPVSRRLLGELERRLGVRSRGPGEGDDEPAIRDGGALGG